MSFAESGGPITHCTSWAPGGEEAECARPLKGEWRACSNCSEAGPETRGSQWPAPESPGGLDIPPSSSKPSGRVPSTKLTTGGGGHSLQDPPGHHGGNHGPGLQSGVGNAAGVSTGGVPPCPANPPLLFALLGLPFPPLTISPELALGHRLGGWRPGPLQPLESLGTWLGDQRRWVPTLHLHGLLTSLFFLMHLFILFIYFWLCWVFVAAHGLSLAVASGGYSSLWCVGFSLWWLLLRSTGSRHVGSVVAARGLSSCGLWALEHRLSSCGARA